MRLSFYWFSNFWIINNWLVSLIIKTKLNPTNRRKLDWVTAIWIFSGIGLPLKPSIIVNTNCPPSKSGKGSEFSTAKFIEIKAANKRIPVPPCSDNWAPISTIFTGPLNYWAVDEKFVISPL